jgi:hypothetical protein
MLIMLAALLVTNSAVEFISESLGHKGSTAAGKSPAMGWV